MDLRCAFLFPGQGAQYVGMGKSLYDNIETAKKIFEEADKVLNFKISELCFSGPLEKLTETVNCQIAVFVHSVVCFEVFKKFFPHIKPEFLAGLSLGEYTCLYAGKVLDFKETLLLVKKRAELMQEASQKIESGMISIIGLDLDTLEEICKTTGAQIANLNSPSQTVISGKKEDILKAKEIAESKGARCVVLNVSGAFHSQLMEPAKIKLSEYIQKLEFKNSQIPIVSNVKAEPTVKADRIKQNLIEQMTNRVLWQKSCEYMVSEGVKLFFELGPQKILRNLFRKINKDVKVLNLGEFEDIEKINDSLLKKEEAK